MYIGPFLTRFFSVDYCQFIPFTMKSICTSLGLVNKHLCIYIILIFNMYYINYISCVNSLVRSQGAMAWTPKRPCKGEYHYLI